MLAVRRVGLAARRGAAARSDRRLRLLGFALHLGQGTRRRVPPPSATPAPGDAIFYGTGPSESAHVGIVAQVLPNGEIVTIEGNYAGHVTRVGPFQPSHPVGEAAPVYGYAQPPTPRQAKGENS